MGHCRQSSRAPHLSLWMHAGAQLTDTGHGTYRDNWKNSANDNVPLSSVSKAINSSRIAKVFGNINIIKILPRKQWLRNTPFPSPNWRQQHTSLVSLCLTPPRKPPDYIIQSAHICHQIAIQMSNLCISSIACAGVITGRDWLDEVDTMGGRCSSSAIPAGGRGGRTFEKPDRPNMKGCRKASSADILKSGALEWGMEIIKRAIFAPHVGVFNKQSS
jgi:hypothetical protein